MSVAALTFWFIALFLAIFGVVFMLYGMSSEKAYWFQRDPQGNPAHEATPFRRIYTHFWRIAISNERAPLRIAAIGVTLVYLAIASLILAVIFTLTG